MLFLQKELAEQTQGLQQWKQKKEEWKQRLQGLQQEKAMQPDLMKKFLNLKKIKLKNKKQPQNISFGVLLFLKFIYGVTNVPETVITALLSTPAIKPSMVIGLPVLFGNVNVLVAVLIVYSLGA